MPAPALEPAALEVSVPNVARMYDFLLGGCHNFRADRDAARQLVALAPAMVAAARANRAFLGRAVRAALRRGVRQFVDLGSGIPTRGAVHEIAHAADPAARVVYVDVDPVVYALADLLLADVPNTGVVQADLRDLDRVLADPVTLRLIDWSRPVAVLAVSVLQFLDGDLTPVTGRLWQRLVPGSLLVICHAYSEPSERDPQRVAAVQEVCAGAGMPLRLRSRTEITALFAGFPLVAPRLCDAGAAGLVPVRHWRPDAGPEIPGRHRHSPPVSGLLAGVGVRTEGDHACSGG